ncbi:MAG: UvrD-helicase domain-containing protein [Ardenticatenaceae bacterium]|nr:UvrD-helicase domain-containing protein [Ardenticatenaceae bacterium]
MTDVLVELTPTQQAAITAEQTSFLLGPAGTGKSFALQQRLLRLLQDGEPAYTLLVIVAEPDQAAATWTRCTNPAWGRTPT